MTTLTTQAGFGAFRNRMCEYFADLPDGLGKQPLHVAQAELGPDTYFTHELGDDGHHVIYDPRQVKALAVRTFLGIYTTFTEGPVLDGARDAYYAADNDASREIWAILLQRMDRTQDPAGVMDWALDLLGQARAEKAGASA